MDAQIMMGSPFEGALEAVAPRAAVGDIAKRIVDVVFAGLLLLLLLPLLLMVALLVRTSSPGPIIFRQQRIGRDGRPFWFYKFRTMVHGNDPSAHHDFYKRLVNGEVDDSATMFKLVNDPRITPVGRILRRFSVDEFPQFFNVLTGDMSLVGPRPPIPYEVELYGPREYARLRVTPGLTGLWQVSGRAALSFQQMIELDLAYVANRSITLDLLILLRTPWAVIGGRGAT